MKEELHTFLSVWKKVLVVSELFYSVEVRG